jgi:serine/threonine-protein kinase
VLSDSVLGGRYRVEARIGAGGMAEVFRGFDPVLNRTVAIKTLLPQFARDEAFVARFRREAQAAARLNHPNIVAAYDTGSDDGTQFIVMEFVEGRTLAEFLATGRRPTPVQASEIAQKIAAALAAAHAQGVIHRDIKPGNVMVTREGTVKVMDFGIARMTTGVETAPQTSAVLGTATYLSPEQAQGSPVDARTDIYSLGAVLYEMVAGRPPFTGESPVAIAYKQVNETPPAPSQINADVPARLDAVIMKALSKNPANRYQTAEEFSSDLDRVVKGQEVEATPLLAGVGDATQVISRPQQTSVLPPVEDEPKSGRKVWLGILIGILIVAVLGGGGYLLVSSLTDDEGGSVLVEVPDVVGKTYDEARSQLEDDLGFVVERKFREIDPADTEPGTVVEQDPVGGQDLEQGGTVTLWVAREPTTVAVPDLSGMTLGQAKSALQDEGLDLGSATQGPSNEFEAGLIFQQDPAAGDAVEKGTLVDVVVSTGPETVTVPDVSTQCLSIGGARQALKDVGLVLALSDETAPMNPACPNASRIVAQDPQAGDQVPFGSTVTVFQGSESSPSP